MDDEAEGRFFGDDALHDAAVRKAEDADFVFPWDDGAGVEDVVEDVVEVVTLAAGEIRGNLGPFAEELVAGGAVFRKDGVRTVVAIGLSRGRTFFRSIQYKHPAAVHRLSR